MTTASNRRAGAAITVIAALGAVGLLVAGHVSITIAVGIAVVGILIGTGVARGKFSSTQNSTNEIKKAPDWGCQKPMGKS